MFEVIGWDNKIDCADEVVLAHTSSHKSDVIIYIWIGTSRNKTQYLYTLQRIENSAILIRAFKA